MSFLRETWKATLRNMQYVAGVGTVVVTGLTLYPHIWGVHHSKSVLQMYRDGIPEPVDEDSKRIAQQVFDKVLWDPTSEAGVDFFTVYGQDIIHRGSTFTKQGAIIGIPVSFKYTSPQDVEKEKITLNNINIDWQSVAGQQLLDSLIFSRKARQFAIARELFSVHTFHMYVKAGLVGISCLVAYTMGFAVNTLYGISRRLPRASRAVVYSLFAGFGATLYCLGSDSYNWYRDKKVDKKAAELGLEYAEGGVEFYNKHAQRNMAMRALLGSEGNKLYTAYGNTIHFWRSPSMPLTARRDRLQEIVKFLKAEESPSESISPASAPTPA